MGERRGFGGRRRFGGGYGGGRRRGGGAGAIIAVLLLVALGVVLFLFLRNRGEDTAGGTGTAAGTVIAGEQDLLEIASQEGELATYENQTVEADSVPVESVVSDQGFWVGEGEDRLFVYTTAAAEVQEGQEVSFSGSLRVLPVDFETRFNLTGDDAEQLQGQGHYIEAGAVQTG